MDKWAQFPWEQEDMSAVLPSEQEMAELQREMDRVNNNGTER